MTLQKMIGKINQFNFKHLIILNTFALVATSYFFNNFVFIGVFTLFFFISLFSTKNGLKIIKKLDLLQNIRTEGPANHLKKKRNPNDGGIIYDNPFFNFSFNNNYKFRFPKINSFILYCFWFLYYRICR